MISVECVELSLASAHYFSFKCWEKEREFFGGGNAFSKKCVKGDSHSKKHDH